MLASIKNRATRTAIVCYRAPCGCELYSSKWLDAALANPRLRTVVVSAVINKDLDKLKAKYEPQGIVFASSQNQELLNSLSPHEKTTLTLLNGRTTVQKFNSESHNDQQVMEALRQ